jgi:AcrR family transcriptional regulator
MFSAPDCGVLSRICGPHLKWFALFQGFTGHSSVQDRLAQHTQWTLGLHRRAMGGLTKKQTPPVSVRKRKGEGAQRRAEILETAKQLFVEEGYVATTIRRIAAKIGISSTALYVYFSDKDAILVEICDKTFAGLIVELDEVRRDAQDPLDALTKSLERYIRFGLDHPNEYELTFLTRRTKELQKLKPENENLGMRAFGRFRDCVDAAVRTGATNDLDTERLTQQLWAAIHGLVALLLLHAEFPWGEVNSLVKGHVTMLVQGVTKTAP